MDFFPLDDQLGLIDGSLSADLAREVVWLSGQLAFEQVSAVLARIGGYSVPRSTVWAHTQQHGERLRVAATQQQTAVGVERTRWNQADYDPTVRKGVSMDGGMVSVRDEGWKELKVGVVSTLCAPDTHSAAERDAPLGHDLHYTAVLGGVADFSAALWALAVQQQVPYAGHVAVTADGAAWIWALTPQLFPCSVQIVDWYHAAQHLDQAAQVRYPTDPTTAHAWAEPLKTLLFEGNVSTVIQRLHAAQLPDQAAYFEEHQRRMQYPSFRADGDPIGSGTTESAVKQYKQRLAGPGMHWSRPGLARMIVLRSTVLDDSFNDRWLAA